MTIYGWDLTFTEVARWNEGVDDNYFVPVYGKALTCLSTQEDGRMSINLSGTGLYLPEEVRCFNHYYEII